MKIMIDHRFDRQFSADVEQLKLNLVIASLLFPTENINGGKNYGSRCSRLRIYTSFQFLFGMTNHRFC